ncbi:MAG TPA: UMP kinase [Pseudomonadales bacterium]|jgi:uridylate kinase|nr:UMP kinase [Pseudomonadales bacterium]
MTRPVVSRYLLKLSGEALAGEADFGIDPEVVRRIGREVVATQATGAEFGVVLGGGNLFRGAALARAGLNRVTGDHMGMLATVMNALAFRDVIQSLGARATVLSAIPMAGMVEGYSQPRAVDLIQAGHVVIFAAGTGNPFFTTDSAACLRGIEIGADIVLKATKVDGVYTSDPHVDVSAQRFDHLNYDAVIARNLKVMDMTAICLCRDHKMPIVVFDMNAAGALQRIVAGERVGTLIDGDAG